MTLSFFGKLYSELNMISIFVDADACPVKQEVIKVAERYSIKTFIVSNGGIRPSRNPLIKYVYVAHGLDEADKWIETQCNSHSIVITDDIPLSKKCIVLDARVVNFRGKILDKENIGGIEASRNLLTSLREANGPNSLNHGTVSRIDKGVFIQSLDHLIRKK